MINPLLKKNIKASNVYVFLVFLSILFFSSCNTSKKPIDFNFSQDEKIALEKFFEELLIEHDGMYTLFGKKPMTIEFLFNYSDTEILQLQNYLENHPEISTIQEERFLEEAWSVLKKTIKNKLFKNFIISEVNMGNTKTNESILLFINIKETALTLQKHYNDFQSVYGKTFHPVEVIHNLKKGNDEFWKSVLSNSATLGLLLGYGYKNSWLYKWKEENNNRGIGFSINSLNPPPVPKHISKYYLKNRPFRLPSFAWLDKEESTKLLDEYQQNRLDILKAYKNQDFLDTTLEKLYQ